MKNVVVTGPFSVNNNNKMCRVISVSYKPAYGS
jgi:hypothetical protein